MSNGPYLPRALFWLVKEIEDAPQCEMAGLACEFIQYILVAAVKRDPEEYRAILNGVEIHFHEYYYEETEQEWNEPLRVL